VWLISIFLTDCKNFQTVKIIDARKKILGKIIKRYIISG